MNSVKRNEYTRLNNIEEKTVFSFSLKDRWENRLYKDELWKNKLFYFKLINTSIIFNINRHEQLLNLFIKLINDTTNKADYNILQVNNRYTT